MARFCAMLIFKLCLLHLAAEKDLVNKRAFTALCLDESKLLALLYAETVFLGFVLSRADRIASPVASCRSGKGWLVAGFQ